MDDIVSGSEVVSDVKESTGLMDVTCNTLPLSKKELKKTLLSDREKKKLRLKVANIGKKSTVDFSELTECPACGGNWDGGDIFEIIKGEFTNLKDEEIEVFAGQFGWKKERPKRFSKLIALTDPSIGDYVCAWRCPHCTMTWERTK